MPRLVAQQSKIMCAPAPFHQDDPVNAGTEASFVEYF